MGKMAGTILMVLEVFGSRKRRQTPEKNIGAAGKILPGFLILFADSLGYKTQPERIISIGWEVYNTERELC